MSRAHPVVHFTRGPTQLTRLAFPFATVGGSLEGLAPYHQRAMQGHWFPSHPSQEAPGHPGVHLRRPGRGDVALRQPGENGLVDVA